MKKININCLTFNKSNTFQSGRVAEFNGIANVLKACGCCKCAEKVATPR